MMLSLYSATHMMALELILSFSACHLVVLLSSILINCCHKPFMSMTIWHSLVDSASCLAYSAGSAFEGDLPGEEADDLAALAVLTAVVGFCGVLGAEEVS